MFSKMFKTMVIGVGLAAMSTAYATDYLTTKPLDQRINVNSLQGPVSQSNARTLPVITWAEDMRTIYANGGVATTGNGSIFADAGLNFRLARQDNFIEQVESYLRGETPYLRGTMTMITLVNNLTQNNPDLKPVVINQLSWSAGGDTLVVKEGINKLSDLKGKTIVLQQDGPHIHLLSRALRDGGLTLKDVNIRWVESLTNAQHTPVNAFYESDVDAAFMIIPDALALTACSTNCGVGDGSDSSVKGARILFSTKAASRVVSDVYAVRSDYLKANRNEVQSLVHELFKAKEAVDKVSRAGQTDPAYVRWIKSSAQILMDDSALADDAGAMFGDAYHAGFGDNISFFTDASNLRNFENLSNEIQTGLMSIGLISNKVPLRWAEWDYNKLKVGLSDTAGVVVPKFNKAAVSQEIQNKLRTGTLSDSQFLEFPIYFQPNQNTFTESQYASEFDKFLDYSSTYGGAVITIEGHCDPHGYLTAKYRDKKPTVITDRLKQSCVNLSVTRATAARDAIIAYGESQGISLNESQFEIIGHGFHNPATGICSNGDPCKINSKEEWLSNMRVVVAVTVIEAEVTDFESF